MPNVSVILPAFNRVSLLGRAIDSILSQTYSDFELIVVDDCSTDNTEQFVAELASKDGRIRYIKHSENSGVATARNTGIDLSAGRYIAFQDDDDEWLPDKLERHVAILDSLPNDVVMTYCLMTRICGS